MRETGAYSDSFVFEFTSESIANYFVELFPHARFISVSFVGVYFRGQSENVLIVFQSREDKPDLPEEQARILAAGGYVNIPRSGSGDVPRAYYIDENRKARYGLAMSRSLGDWKVPGVM